MVGRLQLKFKMICGFTLIAIIGGVIGLVGIRGLHNLTGNLVTLSQNDYVFSNLAEDALYGIMQHRRLEKDFLLFRDDPASVTKHLIQFEASATELRDTLFRLNELSKDNPRIPAEARILVKSLPELHETYTKGFHSAASRIKDGPKMTVQQVDELMIPYKKSIYSLETKIRTIRKIGDGMAYNIVTSSIQESSRQRILLSVVVAAGFLFALFLGFFVAGWISRPITQISLAAEELRKGNCQVEIGHYSGDELGCMAEAFRHLVAAQQHKVEMAQKIAAGDFDAPLKLASEQDTLGKALQVMSSDLKRYLHDLTETTAAKERMQSELRMATDIQASLLPRIFPAFPDRPEFDIFAIMDPAKEVGGDFYDFFFVDDRKLFFLIADVSDKGMPAALYMMVAKTLIKSEAMQGVSPSEVLGKVNNLLAPDNDNCMFVTVFCALLDTVTGEMSFANAGHNPPLICTAERKTEFIAQSPGLVLGAMADISYESRTLNLRPQDVLLLYTDGVTEAMNHEAAMFGEKRLLEVFAAGAMADIAGTVNTIREEVRIFSGDTPQSDDITMLAFRFTGAEPFHPKTEEG